MAAFSYAEMTDFVLIYGRAFGNVHEAQRLYQEEFLGRRLPHHTTFSAIFQRLRENGKFQPSTTDHGRERTEHVIEVEPEILEIVEEIPSISIRRLSYRLGVSLFVVWRTLKGHPYHVQRVQSLKPEDLPRRVRFCEWLLQKIRVQSDFVQKLLIADEATFTREGVFNSRNTYIWSDENSHAIRETHFQDRFSVNVWAGMVNNNLIGPYVLPPRLTAVAYLDFLNNDLGPLLENVPLNKCGNGLTETFQTNGLGGMDLCCGHLVLPISIPVIFLWGYMKQVVYQTPVNTMQELTNRIQNVAAQIRNNPDMVRRTQQSLIQRAEACVQNRGRHFENLL
ncbi:hypothetical protein Zmor_001533 [Zophobas morio]|uniref:DUF4817 domain-containing protein n=1 Tax=Zophobas morio TaxID=2755281 RepID=A0AA38J2Q9_9CUCU|nr:hypothetical protein Zmor_001533 [Zophobas morio]